MTEDWKKYEQEVYDECCRIYGEDNIEKNVVKVGIYSQVERQIDVIVHADEGDIVFDAKCYSKRVNIKTIEAMIGMYEDLGVNRFVVVTNIGYSKAALRRAHLGAASVEADVVSMAELSRLQNFCALPYAGRNGVFLAAPFGWIVDGQISAHPEMVAVLYQRGLSFEEAFIKEKEFAYIGFWDREDEISTLPQLMKHHKDECLDGDEKGVWKLIEDEPFPIAQFVHTKAVVTEYFGYKEFEQFIFYVVLFCEKEKWGRNLKKVIYILDHALPIRVRRAETIVNKEDI